MDNQQLHAAAIVTIARTGITLDTLAKLLECNHGLSAWCLSCRRA
jgi:hypothetical protein